MEKIELILKNVYKKVGRKNYLLSKWDKNLSKLLELLLVLDVRTLDKSREKLTSALRVVLLNPTQPSNLVTQHIDQSESLIRSDVHKTRLKLVKPSRF